MKQLKVSRIKTAINEGGYEKINDFIEAVSPDVSLGTIQSILRGARVTEKQGFKIYEKTGVDLLTIQLETQLQEWEITKQNMNENKETHNK